MTENAASALKMTEPLKKVLYLTIPTTILKKWLKTELFQNRIAIVPRNTNFYVREPGFLPRQDATEVLKSTKFQNTNVIHVIEV